MTVGDDDGPLVSVIVIFLDAEAFLDEAIASVLRQTWGNWELLLVDDGSTDASAAIARRHCAEHPGRVRYLHHEGLVNRGMSASRNLGLREAAGELVAFLDADDVWPAAKLAEQVAVARAHPRAGMICGAMCYWRSWDAAQGLPDRVVRVGAAADRVVRGRDLMAALYPLGDGQAPCPSVLMVRRQVASAVGGFEENFTGALQMYEDQAFLAKVYAATDVYVSSRVWVDYRQHARSCVATVSRDGLYQAVRRHFLEWLERRVALAEPNGAVAGLVARALWPYRCPTLISVLIPACNAEGSIRECLASALGQSYRNIEVIVVDDGSTDGTAGAVREVAARDDRVRLVAQPNGGVAAARNTALSHARGELVAPLDADDLWLPTKLERQALRLLECPEAAMAYCWSADLDEAGRVIQRPSCVPTHEGDVYAALVLGNFVANSSAPLIRRSRLVEAGGWDPSLHRRQAQGCEDWKLYLALAERHEVVLVPDFLVGYRRSSGAMSLNADAMLRSYDLVMAEARQRHPELPQRLFRWSRAAYRAYLAGLSRRVGRRHDALRHLGAAMLLDPAWLARRSVRRSLRATIARHLRGVVGMRRPAPPREPFGPVPRGTVRPQGDGWIEVRREHFIARLCRTSVPAPVARVPAAGGLRG